MKLQTSDLKYALDVVKKSIHKGLTGAKMTRVIHFECKGKVLSITGLDGFRGHFLKYNVATDEEFTFNIEHFDVPKYAGLLVEIYQNEDKVIFDFETVLIRKENIELSTITGYPTIEKLTSEKKPVFKIAFNPKYIKEALAVLPKYNDCVVFEFYGSTSPGIIKVQNELLKSDVRLILPVRSDETAEYIL